MARIEHDFIGDLEVPANAYYGVQSLRGKENFFITEEKNNQEIYFIIAFAYVKKAARWLIRNSALLNLKLPMQ